MPRVSRPARSRSSTNLRKGSSSTVYRGERTIATSVTISSGSGGNAWKRRSSARSDSGSFVPEASVVRPVKTKASAATDATSTTTHAPIVHQGYAAQARAIRSVRPMPSGCHATELLVQWNQCEPERLDSVGVRDDVVAVLEHLEQVARQRDVAREPLRDERVGAHHRHRHVHRRPADAERTLQARPEL